MSKRILSLVLALVMVLGTFGTVFAEETGSGSEKIDWLVKQGIVQGTSQGLELDKTVDRATLARLVAVALNEEAAAESLKLVPSGFVDMNTAHWANGYAALANGRGYMVGNAKREFMPSKATTYAEVLSVLVRVNLGRDLTDAEKAGAITWYAPYVAKAAELGITEGVSVANVGGEAVRKDVLEMLYNVLQSTKNARYEVLKAIVLENSRVAKLGDTQIKVEILEEVVKANYVDASRKVKGEQRTIDLKDLKDLKDITSENLLGRVADFTFDKDGKLVDVKIDTTYEIVADSLKATETRLGSYRVEIKEKHDKVEDADRTLFRTYYNNEDFAYEDYYVTPNAKGKDRTDNFTADYVRATIKDGRVLFINAFDFEDILPVQEVKDNRIYSYDDTRDGSIKRIDVDKDVKVVLVQDDVLSKGTLEDVKEDNVIHQYGKDKYIVLQDKAISGKLDKITEGSKTHVVVDEKSYEVPAKSPKQAVYEFESDSKFYTLTPSQAYADLKNFRGESVKVLLDLGGKLQYIGSEVDLGEFVGVATKIVGKDMRVLRNDNKEYDYEATLDTVVRQFVNDKEETGHKELNKIDKNTLVYVRAKDGKLEKVVNIPGTEGIKTLTTRYVNDIRILDETLVYVINSEGEAEVRKIKEVVDAWEDLKTDDQKKVEVSILTDEAYETISIRGDNRARSNEAHSLLFYGLNIEPEAKDAFYAKFIRYEDRRENGSELKVELDNGSTRIVKLDKGIKVVDNLKADDIIQLQESKATENLIVRNPRLVITDKSGAVVGDFKGIYEVKDISAKGEITLVGETKTIFEQRKMNLFGNALRAGDKIAFELDKDNYIKVVVNYGKDKDATGTSEKSGIVTYRNTTVGYEAFAVDGKLITVTKDMVLVENNQIIASGSAIVVALKDGDQVEIKGDRITRVKKADDLAQAVADKFKADYKATLELTVATVEVENETAVKAAQAAFDKLSDEAKAKLTAEKTLLAKLQARIDELKGESADQDMVNAELAKVPAKVVLADNTTIDVTNVTEAVENLVILNKVKVVVADKTNGQFEVTLTSRTAGSTATKTITVTNEETVEKEKDQAMVEAELAKVPNDLELATGSEINVTNVTEAVENLVILNKVKVVVADKTNGQFEVTLTSRTAGSTATAAKTITVTVK